LRTYEWSVGAGLLKIGYGVFARTGLITGLCWMNDNDL
jgi:hypothetical protein